MRLERNIRLLGWCNFLNDFRPYFAIAALYFADVAGSFTLGMTAIGLIMLSQSVFEVPTGVLSDFLGRRHRFAVYIGPNVWYTCDLPHSDLPDPERRGPSS